jgi:Uma2 family endonuclease
MATARPARPKAKTKTLARAPQDRPRSVADLLHRLGNIPAHRVRLDPPPGTATEKDVLRLLDASDKVLCELVEGVLVAKPMGANESEIAAFLLFFVLGFVRRHKLGIVLGSDAPFGLAAGLLRFPDVSFVSWDRLPGRKRTGKPILTVAPDLAVEVLSKSNTKAEMARKLRDYFRAGTRLVWIIDPKSKTVHVHTSPEDSFVLQQNQTLDGGAVLPGFRLVLRELFAPDEG